VADATCTRASLACRSTEAPRATTGA
jgi:hypothetical protein